MSKKSLVANKCRIKRVVCLVLLLISCLLVFYIFVVIDMPTSGADYDNPLSSALKREEAVNPIYKQKTRIRHANEVPIVKTMRNSKRSRVTVDLQDTPIKDNASKTESDAFKLGDTHFEKIVHLDFKGAAPKLDYLKLFFAELAAMGATGILVEYDDMFPYHGSLREIRARNSYTRADIAVIQQLASENHLLVIPLVQTFGHIEFILKLEKFAEFREMSDNPCCINAIDETAVSLVKVMIDQVLAMHPHVSYLHIGCDEVYALGKSNKSQEHLKIAGINSKQLFLRYVDVVASYVKSRNRRIGVIMWDDMFRTVPVEYIQQSNVRNLVEPMIWCYTSNISERVNSETWQKYSKVFTNIWIASAFKGATGSWQFYTDPSYHVQNHLAWIDTIRWLKKLFPHSFNIKGWALTGWSRYDHFSVLCDLLPSAMPSLASCLQTILHFQYNARTQRDIGRVLHCRKSKALSLTDAHSFKKCSFKGQAVFLIMLELREVIHRYEKYIFNNGMKIGWLNDFNVAFNFSSPRVLRDLSHRIKSFNETLKDLEYKAIMAMSGVFYQDTITEWLYEYIKPFQDSLTKLSVSVDGLLQFRKWPVRPLT